MPVSELDRQSRLESGTGEPVSVTAYYEGMFSVRYLNDGDPWPKPMLRIEPWRDQSARAGHSRDQKRLSGGHPQPEQRRRQP